MPRPKDAPRFPGFDSPRYTPIPDYMLDHLMADLSGAELKVLLYIMRRTFGWKKESDDIGLKQLTSGITARDGRVVDRGTGLAKSSVVAAIKSLEEWGIIERRENSDAERGDRPSTYRVRLSNTGDTENRTAPLPETDPPRVRLSNPQEPTYQEPTQEDDTLDDAAYAQRHGAGLPSVLRLELKLKHTKRGKLDREAFVAAARAKRGER